MLPAAPAPGDDWSVFPPPPPDPPVEPVFGDVLPEAPPPPAVDVIVENIELFPLKAGEPPGLFGELLPTPPAPTVIGYVCAETVNPSGAAKGEAE